MYLLFQVIAGSVFALSSGLLFNERFRRSYLAIAAASAIAITSSVFLLKDLFHQLVGTEKTAITSMTPAMRDPYFDLSGGTEKCYVLTREGIKILNRVGVDPDTGRECKRLTPQMMERYNAYKNGNRPQRVTGNDPVFFDPVTGESVLWYARTPGGQIELYDLMGYHPKSGEELKPIDKHIVAEWRSQMSKIVSRAPNQVLDPDKFGFFDPTTGEPKLWVWVNNTGDYTFYDGPGFHQQSGEALKVATQEVIVAWRSAIERKSEGEAREARARAAQELNAKQAAFEAKKLADQKAEEERSRSEADARRRTEESREKAEAEARLRAEEERKSAEAEARKRADEERKRIEAEAKTRAEEVRRKTEKRTEEQRILDSYAKTTSGALCRNVIRSGDAFCDCGHFGTLGPCDFAGGKRPEGQRILDSYAKTTSGALCRNVIRSGDAFCDCGHFGTLGPCEFALGAQNN